MENFLPTLLLFLAANFQLLAQNIENQQIAWFAVQHGHQFSEKNRLVFDGSSRHFFQNLESQVVNFRFKFNRQLGEGWDFAPGFGIFWNHRNRPAADRLTVHEIRPSIEFNNRQTLVAGWQLNHRFGCEGRFFQKTSGGKTVPGHRFNWRFRYRFGADLDLKKIKIGHKPLKIRLFDEFLANAGKNAKHRFFDQNRLVGGLVFPVADWFSVETVWMKVFQSQSNSTDFFDRENLRLTLIFQSK